MGNSTSRCRDTGFIGMILDPTTCGSVFAKDSVDAMKKQMNDMFEENKTMLFGIICFCMIMCFCCCCRPRRRPMPYYLPPPPSYHQPRSRRSHRRPREHPRIGMVTFIWWMVVRGDPRRVFEFLHWGWNLPYAGLFCSFCVLIFILREWIIITLWFCCCCFLN